jgi:hypothetical protein
MVAKGTGADNQASYHIALDGSTWKYYLSGNGSTWSIASGVSMGTSAGLNTWQHIALVRSGSTFTPYVNGVAGTTTTSATALFDSNKIFSIGSDDTGAQRLTGYISGVRVVKGTSLTITVPTTPPTAITNTSLLCNFTNAGIFDNSGKNVIETIGNVQIDTAVKKYGTGSLEFDGTGDWLLMPYTPDHNFGSGNFTVEAWVYPSATGSVLHICGVNITTSGTASNQSIVMFKSATEKLVSYAAVSSTEYRCTSSGNLTANQWTHIAFVRNGSTVTQYINGVADGTATISTNSINNIVSPFGVGQVGQIITNGWNGYIDDFRITKGVARYTANFTPPAQAFPNL